jgi:tRNA pseudouridine55 synthase
MDGVLVIDKPPGMTSHDVVDQVRRRLGTRKVGHGGTLDPDATGVLVVGVGRATRFLSYAQASPKRYAARVRLGSTTTTQDASGEVLEERSVEVDESQIEAALQSLTGDIQQVPPMVSAIRIDGERLYEKARRGEDVERKSRSVTVYELRLTGFRPAENEVDLDVRCSAGTYVRTLAHDLGQALACGAHLVELRRTEAGGWTLEDTIPLDDVAPEKLRALAEVVRDLSHVEVDEETARLVRNGRKIAVDQTFERDDLVAVLSDGGLLGVYRQDEEALRPERVVSS